ncbi:MAG TPA: winged helix-turn-helix transcriptional regulator, partial [Methylomirabilota bacterium]|nr:winged helix-turn-helix transcriptional regulator [Methylomirabilota bacterium]
MALRGTNQEFGRPYNRRIVIEAIRLNGPITRADIAKQVGLTLQTVSTITSELQEQGFVILRRTVPKGRGFPAPSLEINPAGGFAVGVHVTPRGIQAALVNLAGEIVASDERVAAHIAPDVAFQEIARLVGGLCAPCAGQVLGVGLAMPGPF